MPIHCGMTLESVCVCVCQGTDAHFICFSMACGKTEQVGMKAGSVGGWKPTHRPAAGEQRWHCHVVSTQKAGSKGVTAHFHLPSYTWQEAAAGGKASEMRLHFPSLSHALSLLRSLSHLFSFCIISCMSISFLCTPFCRELLQNRSQLRVCLSEKHTRFSSVMHLNLHSTHFSLTACGHLQLHNGIFYFFQLTFLSMYCRA